MTDKRYAGSMPAFSEDELAIVRGKSVCVVGCGGLGGYVCNGLARFGVGRITVADADVFTEGNLNRQLFANEHTLGLKKVMACRDALKAVNSDLELRAVCEMLDESNARDILSGHDIVIDCLDSPSARLILEKHCKKLELPFVHGAVNGFMGQVSVVFPGDGLMERLYGGGDKPQMEEVPPGSPVFTVQAVSALQCCEALKLLAGRLPCLRNRLLHINLLDNEFQVVQV